MCTCVCVCLCLSFEVTSPEPVLAFYQGGEEPDPCLSEVGRA